MNVVNYIRLNGVRGVRTGSGRSFLSHLPARNGRQGRFIHQSRTAQFTEPAAAMTPELQVKLNFAVPYASIYSEEPIHTVTLPGLVGEYGVTGAHQPIMSELKPGLVQIYKTDGGEPEKFFVSGGFAVTHADAKTDVSVSEAVKLDELDPEAAKKGYNEYKLKMEAAPAESQERAQLQIAVETYEAMCYALGIQVS